MPSRAPSQLNRMRRSVIGSQSIHPCSGPYIAATPPCLLLIPRPVSPTSGRSRKATCGETRSATPWQLQMAPEHWTWWQSMKIGPDDILSISLVSEITKQTLPDHHLVFNIDFKGGRPNQIYLSFICFSKQNFNSQPITWDKLCHFDA